MIQGEVTSTPLVVLADYCIFTILCVFITYFYSVMNNILLLSALQDAHENVTRCGFQALVLCVLRVRECLGQ